ncbi:MAG: hypothetical protein L6V88_09390 [Anaerotruncus sp.]|nr:MAG: hypothetical protein L6V88_09390 [Anaerotruncus sp.]
MIKCKKSGRAYDYVHLISGADLPIKSNDEIHRFFLMKNAGRQFVHFTADNVSESSEGRIKNIIIFSAAAEIFSQKFWRKLPSGCKCSAA